MRRLLPLLSALLLAAGAGSASEPLVVFSRNDVRPLSSGKAPTTGAQAAFWAAYREDRAAGTRYELELPLVSPPEWGKTIGPKTGGRVQYHRIFPRGFVCRISLHDLVPNHLYILTLNGNPLKDGNVLLPMKVPNVEREKYYDFLDFKSDEQGGFDTQVGIFLEPGRYDVRIYVKDAGDFKIVLFREFFPFVAK
jgi:hypothetical protein